MWEYDRINFEAFKVSDITKKLNELSAEDWEIVYYDESKPEKFGDTYKIIIVIKRKKHDN